MELKGYARVLWHWLWLIVLGVTVALASTYYVVHDQPPIYQAQATLIVGQVLRQQQPNESDIYLSQDLALTYSELARQQVIQEKTQAALRLTWLPQYAVNLVPNTQILTIRVTDTDPVRAAAVANELANQLKAQGPQSQAAEDKVRQDFVRQQLDDLQASITATKDEIAKLQKDLAGMFSAREIADTQNQIAALQQKLGDDQSNYGQLLAYMEQSGVNTLDVYQEARVPTQPVGPNKIRTLLMAGAVGLVLAVATAFLLEYLDDTIRTPEDVTKSVGLTTLGGISRIPGDREDKLITIRHPKAAISEAYRVLRTNLQFSSLDKPLKSLVVTSPNPVEGKSTTVANLAVVMAQAGKRVILVDADLRRPALHRLFRLPNDRGLTDLLLDSRQALDGHLQPTGVENLRLLSTGALPPNPSELLGSQRMAALVERLESEADAVLFDSPPSLAVADASVLATQTDGVLLVADAGRTRPNRAAEAVERLRQVGANLVGVALNRLRPERGDYYSYYYYSTDRRRRRWRENRQRPAGPAKKG